MKDKRLNIRISEDLVNKIKLLSEKETISSGYKISVANIIRKALKEFVERNNHEN